MHAAFLFDSDDPKYAGYYGWPIMETVLATRVLQSAGSSIDIAHGDLQLHRYPRLAQPYLTVTQGKVCGSDNPIMLKTDRVSELIARSVIYGWVIKGISREVADALNTALWSDSAFLGAHEVHTSQPAHRALLVTLMEPLCRIKGTLCTLFYSSLNGGERDEGVADALLEMGFVERIWWEDQDMIGPSEPKMICSFPTRSSSPRRQSDTEEPSLSLSHPPEVRRADTHDRVVPVNGRGQRVPPGRRR